MTDKRKPRIVSKTILPAKGMGDLMVQIADDGSIDQEITGPDEPIMGQLTAEAAAAIACQIAAERTKAGIPHGFSVPEKPIPPTPQAIEDELAVVEAELSSIVSAVTGANPPQGQEGAAMGQRMVTLRDRRWKLRNALRT